MASIFPQYPSLRPPRAIEQTFDERKSRTDHPRSAQLHDGKVLVAGGAGLGDATAVAEIYDPLAGAWTGGTTR